MGVVRDHDSILDESQVDLYATDTDRRENVQGTPQISVRVVNPGYQLNQRELVLLSFRGSGKSRDELAQNSRPAFSDQVSIWVPVFDDVPQPVEREEPISSVGLFKLRVSEFILEAGVSDTGLKIDEELFFANEAIRNTVRR